MSGESQSGCDGGAVQSEIALWRKGLFDKSKSIPDLMDDDGFLPAIIFGLQTGSSEVKLDVMSILDTILAKGPEPEKNAVVLSGVITALIPLLLTCDDNDSYATQGQALHILRWVIENTESREIFLKSDILPALTQVVATTRRLVEERLRLMNALDIVMKITATDANDGSSSSSSSSILKFLRLLAKLLRRTEDDTIANNVMVVLSSLLQKEGGIPVLISSGILSLVIDLLAGTDEELQSLVFLLIGRVADECGSDKLKICEFFEALKGSSGMKHYNRVMKFIVPEPSLPRIYNDASIYRNGYYRLLVCINSALLDSEDLFRIRMTTAVMASGLDYGLLQLLSAKGKERSTLCQLCAMLIVDHICRVLDEEVALQPLLDLLKWSYSYRGAAVIHDAAIGCLQILIRYNSKCWDELIRLGGLRRLIRSMKKDKSPRIALGVLGLLGEMLREKPEWGLDPSKKVAKCLHSVVSNLADFRENTTTLNEFSNLLRTFLDCLDKVANYGKDGMKLIRRTGSLQALITALSEGNVWVQKNALRVLKKICPKDKGCCRETLKLGVLDCLPPLLQSESVEMKSLAFVCLAEFVGGKLTSGQASKVLSMIDLIPRPNEAVEFDGEYERLITANFWLTIKDLRRKQKKWWRKLI